MSSEEERSPYPFRLFYFWVGSVLQRGWKRNQDQQPMEFSDLLTLPEDESAVASHAAFKEHWAEAVRKFEALPEEKREGAVPGIFMAFVKSFPHGFVMSGIGRLLADGCTFASPFILREFINWLGKYVYVPGTNSYEGFIWAIALALLQLTMSFFNNMSFYYSAKTFAMMRSAVAVSVFEKSMSLPADHGLTGVASQLHTTDSSKFIELAFFFHQMWSSVLLIIGSLIALYFFIGYAGLIALGIIVVITPFQGAIMGMFAATRRNASLFGDRRMTAVNELVQGIRIVKFMGWEKAIMKRIQSIRSEEMGQFTKLHTLRSAMVIIMSFQPPLVSFIVFTFAHRYFDEEITATRIFPALAMLNVLRLPLAFLPMSLSKFVDFRVSLDRIARFLLTPSRETYVEFAKLDTETAVKLKNVSVEVTDSVTGDKARILNDVTLNIPKNKLTIVTGPTGSGKSTLIQAMIGEMPVTHESSVVVDGTFAYVPQEPWIVHSTVRRNIVLAEEEDIDQERYLKAVKSCQLMADLHQLKASDETMIGELGINISGGQKQRVALARSVYCKHDVVLLDDPLSAVDSHVCTSIFDEAVCGTLVGRTRVLVTHHVQFLPRADYIVLLDEGKVKFAGTYAELQSSNIDVSSLLKDDTTPSDEAEKVEKDIADLDLDDVDKAAESEAEAVSNLSLVASDTIPKAPADALMSTEQQELGGVSGATFLWYVGLLGPFMISLTVFLYLV
jgi:ATP-binding cassette subfamily C (CFTR/MRP) protein 1